MQLSNDALKNAEAQGLTVDCKAVVVPVSITFSEKGLALVNEDRVKNELPELVANNTTKKGFLFSVNVDYSKHPAFVAQAELGPLHPAMAKFVVTGVSYDNAVKDAAKALFSTVEAPTQAELDEASTTALYNKGNRVGRSKIPAETQAMFEALVGSDETALKAIKKACNIWWSTFADYPSHQLGHTVKELVGTDKYLAWKEEQGPDFGKAIMSERKAIQKAEAANQL